MKRFIGLLTTALIIFTGCASEIAVSQPGETETNSKPTSSSPSSQVNYQDNYAQAAAERMAGIDMQDLTSLDLLRRLSMLNISASIENIKPISKTELTFELCLSTTSGDTLRLPIEAACSYDYLQEPIGNFKVEWGGISIADSKTLAVSTLINVRFYSIDNLELLQTTLDLSDFQGKDYYLLGAARDQILGIVVPMFYDNRDGFAYFNEDGTLNRIENFEGNAHGRWFYSDINPPRAGHNPVRYQDGFDILNLDVRYLVFGDRSKVFYNTKTQQLFGEAYEQCGSSDGNRRAVIYNFDAWLENLFPITGKKSRLALFYENGEFKSGFFFDGTDISHSFGCPELEGYSGLRYNWAPTSPVLDITCSFSDLTITLDFNKNMALFQYNILPRHLGDTFATSPDGYYSLATSSRDGAGDIIKYSVVLKDNTTGTYRFVSNGGGMYGGYENIGFFQNGEIYVQTLSRLRIISSNSAAPYPLLDFAMPLGYIKEKDMDRWLLTFRRDPETHDFIILYTEHPTENDYSKEFPYEAKFNYIVGFCDKNGNLLESYDTGQPILEDNFGIYKMGLALSDDNLTIIGKGQEEGSNMQGIFNLKTHTYKNTLSEKVTQ